MLKSRKSKLLSAMLFACAGLLASVSEASIIRDNGRVSYGTNRYAMSTILMVPLSETQANALYQMQRAHSWGNYRRSRGAVGYSTASGVYGAPTLVAETPRQANMRMNMARAHAFGHGYFNHR